MLEMNKSWQEEALTLLKDVIEITTISNENKEGNLAEYIAGFLKGTCNAEIQALPEGKANVIAEIRGENREAALLLNGHLDTVPFGDLENWKTNPGKAVEQNGRIFGRGASDMKSGLCAYLYAFYSLAKEGFMPRNSIIFAGTADEEVNGLGAYGLVEKGILNKVSAVLIGEPTGNRLSIAAKGTLWIEFHIDGKTSHSSYPEQGINACEKAFELYWHIKGILSIEEHGLLGKSTCTMTKIKGGVANNMVPDKCTFSIDIRTLPGVSHERLLLDIDNAVAVIENENKGISVSKHILTNRISVAVSEENTFIQEFSKAVQAVLSASPKITGTNFFSDASIYCLKHSPSVLLFGPGESDEAHKPNESVEIEKYFKAIAVLYRFLKTK